MKNFIGLKNHVICFSDHVIAAMFPNCYGTETNDFKAKKNSELLLAENELIDAIKYVIDNPNEANTISSQVMAKLPVIEEMLKADIESAYEGDPAATSTDEIILCYPAFKAIAAHRIAHQMYLLNIPVIPRILSELAHAETGIDIHPGATIGSNFFIDHGTGVVIGETTIIGNNVKLYQHVTLGAKSFAANDDGSLVKGIKRHPNIGNNVVIYAGATILGGDTFIGDNSIIGGNVWLVHSVPAGSTVINEVKEYKNIAELK